MDACFEVHGDDGRAPFKGDIRICFAWEAEDALVEGIQRLGSLLKRMLENPSAVRELEVEDQRIIEFRTLLLTKT